MSQILSRRKFLERSIITATGVWVGTSAALARKISPNDQLNIGVIGTHNRAAQNILGVQNQNIVAICDVDDLFLNATHERFPAAKTYNDFRKLLDQKDVEAVVVSTPDHTHAVATMAALKSGRPVYCEKPLAHSVWEIRQVTEAAARLKLPTQMGIQIHANENYRRVVELIQSGSIGAVKEVHVWCAKSWSGGERPTEQPPVPSTLHWDLWLGPAPARAYNPAYLPKDWRRWWDFGGGTLGDMACHYMDLPFWALKLHAPTTIEAEGPPIHHETTPAWLIAHYEFPARENLPAVKLTWYDGGKQPDLITSGKVPNWANGVLFVGEKGMLLADYNKKLLLPEKDFADFKAPAEYIPTSMGHHHEWIEACKTGSATSCNFNYSGPLAETVQLGNVAYRTGQKLEWDSKALKVTNTRAADKFIRPEFRHGWKL